jgi:hypothetical protein
MSTAVKGNWMRSFLKLSFAILLAAVSLHAQGIGGKAGIGGSAGIGGGTNIVNPTFTVMQHVFCSVSLTGTNPYTCTITSTGSGHLIVVMGVVSQGSSGTNSFSAVTDSASETYTHASPANQNILNAAAGSYYSTDAWYLLSSSSGVTTVTATWTTTPQGGANPQNAIEVLEVSRSSGSWVLDKATGTTDSTCTSCSGAALTSLSGSYDFLITFAMGNGVSTAPTISGGSWASVDSHTADYTVSYLTCVFADWNGNTSANPTNATFTYTVTDTSPIGALAFK